MPTYQFQKRLLNGARVEISYKTHRDGRILYSVVLIYRDSNGTDQTVRVYDNAHGQNEMHRYTRRGGKQTADLFHPGPANIACGYAIAQAKKNYEEIIRSWQK